MKNVFLLLSFVLFSFSLSAATITWVGHGDGESWQDSDNWDIRQVPSSNDVAIIPDDVKNVVISLLFVEVQRLEIGRKSTVQVLNNRFLQILNSNREGIWIKEHGVLFVEGLIQVIATATHGIRNDGLVYNEGEILIESTGSNGLFIGQTGTLENQENAILKAFNTSNISLRCDGTMTNYGKIELLKGQRNPLAVRGTAYNLSSGEIEVKEQYPNTSYIEGYFYNEGTIQMIGSSVDGDALTMLNNGYLENDRRGDIILTLQGVVAGVGLNIVNDGYVRSNGLIRINSGGRNLNQRGINILNNGGIINRYRGNIEINDFHIGSWINQGINTWKNYGNYDINNCTTAIHAYEDAYNSGTIEAEGRVNIQQNCVFTNSGGEFLINTGAPIGLFVVGEMVNQNCARLRIDGELRIISAGELINNAFLELGEGGNPAYLTSTLINNAVIHDPGDKLANANNNFVNNSIRITPLDDPLFAPCDYTYINVFDLGNAVSVDLPYDFFSTPDLDNNNWAAIYFHHDNEAYLLDHYPVYYAEFVDSQSGCSQIYSIPWEPCSFFNDQSESVELTANPLDTKAHTNPSLRPNPTNGHLQIQAPTSQSGEVTIRVIDALGRLMWEREIPSEITSTIDLPSSLSNGWYVVHFYDAGQLLHSEKVLLQKEGL